MDNILTVIFWLAVIMMLVLGAARACKLSIISEPTCADEEEGMEHEPYILDDDEYHECDEEAARTGPIGSITGSE